MAHPHAGMAVQSVKMFQPVLGQQVVDDEAAVATKSLFAAREAGIKARLAAVKATDTLRGRAPRTQRKHWNVQIGIRSFNRGSDGDVGHFAN